MVRASAVFCRRVSRVPARLPNLPMDVESLAVRVPATHLTLQSLPIAVIDLLNEMLDIMSSFVSVMAMRFARSTRRS